MGFSQFTLDDYTITCDGTVINNKWNRTVKPQKNDKGYLRVCIAGKLRFVHRLVAEKYIPNPDNKPQVNHKDGNKLNNNVDNLEWVTNQENRNHAIQNRLHLSGDRCPWAKLTQSDVDYIRQHKELSATFLSEKFHVSYSQINSIRRYEHWK